MFRKPLDKKLQPSFQSALVQCELSDREQEKICGGQNSRPYTGPIEVRGCWRPNDMLPPTSGQDRC